MAATSLIVFSLAFVIFLQINLSFAKPTPGPTQESNEILETSPDYNELSRLNTQQLLNFLVSKYKRDVEQSPDYSQIYYDDGFVDPRRLKRYQRLGRGRIGGTIVMGKKR